MIKNQHDLLINRTCHIRICLKNWQEDPDLYGIRRSRRERKQPNRLNVIVSSSTFFLFFHLSIRYDICKSIVHIFFINQVKSENEPIRQLPHVLLRL